MRIENIVYLVDFGQNIPIDDNLARDAGLEEMRGCSGFICNSLEDRKRESRAKSMIFPSGKALLLGTKSEDEFESAFWSLVRVIKRVSKLSLKPDIRVEVHNMFVSTNLRDRLLKGADDESSGDFEIDLEKLARDKHADYDPQRFPGVFLTLFAYPDTKGITPILLGTAVVFRSGKVLLGDMKNLKDADILIEKIIEKLA